MEARRLPPRPNLEHYKKKAKNLLKACRASDPRVLHEWVARWVDIRADEDAEVQARLRGVPLTQRGRPWCAKRSPALRKESRKATLRNPIRSWPTRNCSWPASTGSRAGRNSPRRFMISPGSSKPPMRLSPEMFLHWSDY